MTRPKHIVIGSGLTGLFTAMLLAERHGNDVVLIEREASLGGLLRSYDYGEHGWFDYGTHYLSQTGNDAIDDRFYSLLPEDAWHHMPDNRRDLGGIYFQGRVQRNTPYLDLRNLPAPMLREAVADFYLNLNTNPDVEAPDNALALATARFGPYIAEQVIQPILQHIYGKHPADLTPLALRLTPLGRIALVDESIAADLTSSPLLSNRLAYPEQRRLPADRGQRLAGFYPKDGGMQRVIDAIEERLRAQGVTILTEANVTRMETTSSTIQQVELSRHGQSQTIPAAHVYWTVAPPFLPRLLGLEQLDLAFDRPWRTVVVNLLLERPLQSMEDIYYCYCYADSHRLFRIANYSGYCPMAASERGVPYTLELLVDDASDLEALAQHGIDALHQLGVLDADNAVRFARAEVLAGGFPMPTLKNERALRTIREQVAAASIGNLTTLGILSEEGVFFQRDVVHQVWRHVHGTARPTSADRPPAKHTRSTAKRIAA